MVFPDVILFKTHIFSGGSMYSFSHSLQTIHLRTIKLGLKFLLPLIWTILAKASPIPGLSSSSLSQPLKNTLIADDFRLGTLNQDFWDLLPQDSKDEKKLSTWLFQGNKNNLSARFSLHVDKLNKPTELKSYVKKWIKEYPYLGFEILATHSMRIDGETAFVVDLANKAKNKQLRQFVVCNKEKSIAVIMTCTDLRGRFLDTINQCHDILKNFRWSSSPKNEIVK